MAAHSNILAWRIPWKKEPGKLQSMESQRVRTRLSDFTFTEKKKKLGSRLTSTETIEARTQQKHILKLLNVNCQLRILFPEKIFFKHECETNTFSNIKENSHNYTQKTQLNYFETNSYGCLSIACSFLLLRCFQLYRYISIYLYIHLLMDIWVVSNLGLLQTQHTSSRRNTFPDRSLKDAGR